MKLPEPSILPLIVRLCPIPSDAVFEPVSERALPTLSVNTLPLVVAVVVIVALVSAKVDPLSVKFALFPKVPLLPNVSESTVICPMLFVFVVCVVPPKTRLHVPDVVGNVLQFELVDQLALPPPPDHVVVPAAAFPKPNAKANATKDMATKEGDRDFVNDAWFTCLFSAALTPRVVRLHCT